MKTSEFLRQLQRKGCKMVKQGKGSHQKWVGPSGKVTIIPVHSKEIGKGLAIKIEKTLGVK